MIINYTIGKYKLHSPPFVDVMTVNNSIEKYNRKYISIRGCNDSKQYDREIRQYHPPFVDLMTNLKYDDMLITTFVSFLSLYPEKRVDF